jgi:3-oxoacyl-[acyl-carrier-protein] synthase-3
LKGSGFVPVRSFIAGTGFCVPKKVVSNDDLAKTLDTSDEWIFERTGIHQRHIAGSEESLAFLGAQAAQQALETAKMNPQDVGAIILATTSPDHALPATATRIQQSLGAVNAFAMDLQAVCSGFLYALCVAHHFIQAQTLQSALVIGADIMSRLLDWNDRSTCVLFGDGAGAVLLQATQVSEGLLSTALFSNGAWYEDLFAEPSISTPYGRGAIKMNGRTIYTQSIEKMSSAVQHVLNQEKLSIDEVDWFIPHQANKRIMLAVAQRLGLPEKKVIMTIENYANTSAATIPLSLACAERDGLLKQGQLIALAAMGAGATWGATLLRW